MANDEVWSLVASRKSIGGLVCAIIALSLHLFVGLGKFWIFIVLSALIVGFLITPNVEESETELAAAQPSFTEAFDAVAPRFEDLGVQHSTAKLLSQFKWGLRQLEIRYDELERYPLLLGTTEAIAYRYIVDLADAFENVPELHRVLYTKRLDSLLELLNDEISDIISALVNKDTEGLDRQFRALDLTFDRLHAKNGFQGKT